MKPIITRKNKNNYQPKIENFFVANGMSQLYPQQANNDLSPHQYFDGGNDRPIVVTSDNSYVINDEDMYPETREVMLEFSNASGKLKRKLKRKPKSSRSKSKTGQSKFDKIMSYTPFGIAKNAIERAQSPEARALRKQKIDAKKASNQAQAQLQQQILNQGQSDQKAIEALAKDTSATDTTPKGMSTTTKVLIAVGSTLALGIIGFVFYKKFKK